MELVMSEGGPSLLGQPRAPRRARRARLHHLAGEWSVATPSDCWAVPQPPHARCWLHRLWEENGALFCHLPSGTAGTERPPGQAVDGARVEVEHRGPELLLRRGSRVRRLRSGAGSAGSGRRRHEQLDLCFRSPVDPGRTCRRWRSAVRPRGRACGARRAPVRRCCAAATSPPWTGSWSSTTRGRLGDRPLVDRTPLAGRPDPGARSCTGRTGHDETVTLDHDRSDVFHPLERGEPGRTRLALPPPTDRRAIVGRTPESTTRSSSAPQAGATHEGDATHRRPSGSHTSEPGR